MGVRNRGGWRCKGCLGLRFGWCCGVGDNVDDGVEGEGAVEEGGIDDVDDNGGDDDDDDDGPVGIDGEGGIEDSREDTENDMDSRSLSGNGLDAKGEPVDDVEFEGNSEGAEAVIDISSSG